MTLMAQIGDQGGLPITIMDIRDDQVAGALRTPPCRTLTAL